MELGFHKGEVSAKISEKVRHDPSVEMSSQFPVTVISPIKKRTAHIEKLRVGVESIVFAVFVSTINGETRTKIADVANFFGLAWSPESSKIAFSEGTLIHITDSDGQTQKVIYIGPGGPYPGACFDLKWSEDGQKLSFSQVESVNDVSLANPIKVTITLGASKVE